MSEGFDVEPGHLAGFSTLASGLSLQAASLMGHVNNEAQAQVGYTGLLEMVKPPVDAYAQATTVRFAGHVDRLTGMSDELNRAAWLYTGQDEEACQVFNDPLFPGRPTGYKDFPDPVPYPAGEEPSLKPPPHGDADVRALVDEVGGSINIVDDAIAALTGWSPVAELVTPMSGNWTELERAGKVLTQVGDGAELVATNLKSQLGTLDTNWDGGAAGAFMDYAQRLAAGIDQEGPLNRVVAHVYTAVAGEFEKVAQFMVSTLKTAVDKIVQAAATAWIPGYGWVKIINAVRTAIDIIKQAQALVQSLDKVVDSVKTVVDAAQQPVAFAKGDVQAQLAPVKEKIDMANKGVSIAKDVTELTTEPAAFSDTPEEDYSVGANPRRPRA